VNDEILLRPYVEFLWARRWAILGWVALLTAASLLVTFLVPPKYRAHAALVIPSPGETTGVARALAGASSPLTILHGLARSHAVNAKVAREVGIPLDEFRRMVDYGEEPAFSQLRIQATHGSREKALAMATLALRETMSLATRVNMSIGDGQLGDLERALTERQRAVRQAEEDLEQFQKTLKTAPPASGSVNVDYLAGLRSAELELGQAERAFELAKARAEQVAGTDVNVPTGNPTRDRFRDQIIEKEYALAVALTRFGDEAPQVEALRREVEVAKRQFEQEAEKYAQSVDQNADAELARLDAARQVAQWKVDYYRRQNSLAPREAIELARRVREVSARQTAEAQVREQLDEARLTAEVYRMEFTVLQDPYTEGAPVNKKYGLVATLAASISLITVIAAYCALCARRNRQGMGR
jgi:uncharacterized protein involved in exopolysaccharide biosynthesis